MYLSIICFTGQVQAQKAFLHRGQARGNTLSHWIRFSHCIDEADCESERGKREQGLVFFWVDLFEFSFPLFAAQWR